MSETVAVDPEQVADVLEAAADYIEANGWFQGMMLGPRTRTDKPSACAIGAVAVVMDLLWSISCAKATPAVQALDAAVGKSVWKWNDEWHREEWQVDDLLRTTAKRVRHGDITVGQ